MPIAIFTFLSIARLNALSILAAVFIIIIGNPIEPVECTTVSYTLVAAKDVWLEKESTNYNNYDFLIIGKHAYFPKKRSMLQFQDIPNNCTNIISAKMYFWYWYSHKAGWHSETESPHLSHILKAHQIKKGWVETQATRSYRKNGISWSQQYLDLNGTDADATPLDSVFFPNPPPSGDDRWIEFNITSAAQNWVNGQPNYGVVIWSNREDEDGRSLRFYSRERSSNRPYVIVSCSTNIEPQPSTAVVTDTDYTSNSESNTFSVPSNSPVSSGYKGNITMEITVSSNYGSTVTTYSKKAENINIVTCVSIPVVSSTVTPARDTTAHYSMYTSSSYSSSVFIRDQDITSSAVSVFIEMVPDPTIRSTDASPGPSIIGVTVGSICAGVFAFIITSVVVGVILYTRYSIYSSPCAKIINSPRNMSPSTTMNPIYGIVEPEQQMNMCYDFVKSQDYNGSSGTGAIVPLYEEIKTIRV